MSTYPNNSLAQLIVSELIHAEIAHVVISPGSRNAPLIIGLNGVNEIQKFSIADERSAAFFALGIAQQTKKPVALVCTSGSALLNYYPAVAEAYYNQIPLVVISADRPKHLIDVGDGQTIRQENVFQNHCLENVNLPMDAVNSVASKVRNAIHLANSKRGPIHINVPFDEPLYEVTDQKLKYEVRSVSKDGENLFEELPNLNEYVNIWNNSNKKIVLVGSYDPDDVLQRQLEELVDDPSVLVMIENTANVGHLKFINSIDKLIFPFEADEIENFRPDVLLTLGGMIVSKKIKQHLRKNPPKHHWHVDSLRAFDTFHCLNHHFKVSATEFFKQFFKYCEAKKSEYQAYWLQKKGFRVANHQKYLSNCEFSDLKAFQLIISELPKNSNLQLSNSSVIRYSQLFEIDTSIGVFCNRGTSGIDGSMSTAIGAANATSKQTVFITGDISFFYDSNALWNNHIPSNFRIIVINNGGGGIFRFIPGPKESDALDFFETPHNLTAKHLCAMHEIAYITVNDLEDLSKAVASFFENDGGPKLMEIMTPRLANDNILKSYFKALKG